MIWASLLISIKNFSQICHAIKLSNNAKLRLQDRNMSFCEFYFAFSNLRCGEFILLKNTKKFYVHSNKPSS